MPGGGGSRGGAAGPGQPGSVAGPDSRAWERARVPGLERPSAAAAAAGCRRRGSPTRKRPVQRKFAVPVSEASCCPRRGRRRLSRTATAAELAGGVLVGRSGHGAAGRPSPVPAGAWTAPPAGSLPRSGRRPQSAPTSGGARPRAAAPSPQVLSPRDQEAVQVGRCPVAPIA